MDVGALFNGLREIKMEELHVVGRACRTAQERARTWPDRLDEALKSAAAVAIDRAFVAPGELAPSQWTPTWEKLGRAAAAAVGRQGEALCEQLQAELQEARAAEIDHLHTFAVAIDQVTQHLLGTLPIPPGGAPGSLAADLERLAARDRAGAEAAATGQLLAALGVPELQCALLALGPAGVETATVDVEAFKDSFQRAVHAALDRWVQAGRPEAVRRAAGHVEGAFAGLACELDGALDARARELVFGTAEAV